MRQMVYRGCNVDGVSFIPYNDSIILLSVVCSMIYQVLRIELLFILRKFNKAFRKYDRP
jgi:hypothetical protein